MMAHTPAVNGTAGKHGSNRSILSSDAGLVMATTNRVRFGNETGRQGAVVRNNDALARAVPKTASMSSSRGRPTRTLKPI